MNLLYSQIAVMVGARRWVLRRTGNTNEWFEQPLDKLKLYSMQLKLYRYGAGLIRLDRSRPQEILAAKKLDFSFFSAEDTTKY